MAIEHWSKYMSLLEFDYQPIVHGHKGVCKGYEARLSHYQALGFENRGALLTQAAKDGMLPQLSKVLAEKVIGHYAETLGSQSRLRLFLQLDLHLLVPEMMNDLLEVFARYHLPNEVLCFEIRADLPLGERHIALLNQHRAGGFQISLGNCGESFTGLEALYRLNPDYLRFTYPTLQTAQQNERSKLFLANLSNISKLLDSKMVLTHVDTSEALQTAKSFDCKWIQGEFVAPAERWINTQTQYVHIQQLGKVSPSKDQADTPIRGVVEALEAIPWKEDMLSVFERFWKQHDRTYFPVINDEGEPIGVVHEMDLKVFAFSRYGRELILNPSRGKRLEEFLRKMPLADVATPINQLLPLFSMRHAECVIITENQKYLGILTAPALLQALSEDGNTDNTALSMGQSSFVQEYLSKSLELRTAATIQKTFLPKALPNLDHLEVASFFRPASETGGDWYGFLNFKNTLFILIGDVTGHGTPSALMTGVAYATCRTFENIYSHHATPPSPGQLLHFLNQAILEAGSSKYVMTFFAACLDLDSGKLTFSNAGHNFPFLVQKEGKVRKLTNVNPCLGDRPDSQFSEKSIFLHTGDTLLFYTDGLIENESPDGKMWGERKLNRYLRDLRQQSIKELVDMLVESAYNFYGDRAPDDDVTLVGCQVVYPFPKQQRQTASTEFTPSFSSSLESHNSRQTHMAFA